MGWHVEYYENGKIEYERLNYGDSTVVFRYYDLEGNILKNIGQINQAIMK